VKNPPNRVARLTQLHIARAKPRDDPYNIWDASTPGLCLRIQPTGHRALKFVFSHCGKPQWFDLGRIDLATARRLVAVELRPAVIMGRNPLTEKRARGDGDTFSMVADRYLREYAQKRHKKWREARRLIEKYALPPWARRPARSISRADVKALVARIKSPSVANVTLSSISAVFTWAVRESVVEANPCRLVEKHPMRSRERVASDDEIRRLWAVLTDMASVEADALRVGLLTGQRIASEVCNMRWQDIEMTVSRADLSCGWWTLPGSPDGSWPGRKGGNSHRVFLTPLALSIIGETGSTVGPVFDEPRRLDLVMKAACEAAGISPKLTPHDLRRTHATWIGRYFGRAPVSRVLGHSDGSTAAVYDRFSYDPETRAVAERISEHVRLLNEREQPRNLTRVSAAM
jgi:integrase